MAPAPKPDFDVVPQIPIAMVLLVCVAFLVTSADPATPNTTAVSGATRAGRPAGFRGCLSGSFLQVPLSFWHPHQADPNDSPGAFAEYAQSNNWVLVHIGQFVGAMLITLGLVALARHLARQPGITGALAILGGATAVLVAAVFAVQMAVDGVALKAAIDAWTFAAGSTDKAAAFLVADVIRSLEKALSGFFHLCNGVTLLALGLALATGRGFPRWLGWVGTAAGAAFLVEGVVVAQTGFSHQAANIALVPTVLLPVFLIGVAVAMWRTTPITQEREPVQGR